MEGMTSEEHAERISESLINGQAKQALNQFKNAKAEYCDTESLLHGIQERVGEERFLRFVSKVIES